MPKQSTKSTTTTKSKKVATKRPAPKTSTPPVTPVKPLPPAWSIAKKAGLLLWKNKLLFGGISALYILLTMLLVRGFTSGFDTASIQSFLNSDVSRLTASLAGLAVLLGEPQTPTSQIAVLYQMLLALIFSLAIIWALRQAAAGGTGIRIKDAFYKGMYPLVPILLVVLVIIVQLLPLLLGASLYSLVVSSGIATQLVEKVIWGIGCFGVSLVSLYLLSSSVFALYIVTLPDMTPLRALRSARELVAGRRWRILRKLLFLPIALLVIMCVLVLIFVATVTPLAPWVLFVVSMLMLPAAHAYLYTLYRELLP